MKKSIFFLTMFILIISATYSLAAYGVQTKTSHCAANQALPDSACTPGAVLTTNIKTICAVGYTKTVRDVTDTTKKKVFAEYGISYSLHSNYEVDHLISLEIGGSNDISNLWPESLKITNSSLTKDKFENYLHTQVCSGKMTIQEAQKEISVNWLYYDQLRQGTGMTSITKPIINIPKPTAANNTLTQPQPKTTPQPTNNSAEPETKKSSTGLCHEKGTTYYSRTTKFTPYNSLQECLNSGGKLPAK